MQKSLPRFSVNLNKVALLRNSRGENKPNVLQIARKVIKMGCQGITLHPRVDERHATLADIKTLAQMPEIVSNSVELNIEGDLRDDLINTIVALNSAQDSHIHQVTIVPTTLNEKTTTRGWRVGEEHEKITKIIALLSKNTRVCVFIEPQEEVVYYVKHINAAGVEFHTKWYALSFGTERQIIELQKIKRAANTARKLGLCVNLGHDLNKDNLPLIITETLPDEVSIGHALTTEAIEYGLPVMYS